jgi:hypothetical protein
MIYLKQSPFDTICLELLGTRNKREDPESGTIEEAFLCYMVSTTS